MTVERAEPEDRRPWSERFRDELMAAARRELATGPPQASEPEAPEAPA